MLVPQHNARQCFHLDIRQRSPLNLGEVAHLRLGKFDILEVLTGQLVDTILDFGIGQTVAFAVPAIEPHA